MIGGGPQELICEAWRQSRNSAGLARDSPVPRCALLCSTIATAVQPAGLDQFVANGIRQLQNRLSTETRNCPAGSSLQGECRRFDPVSTHQSNYSLTRLFLHAVSRSTVIAGLFQAVASSSRPK